MSGKATQCKVCGSKKLEHGAFCAVHWREYRTNNMRASRSAQKAMAARANPQKPIVVNPKKHKAKGQQMAPPAPRVEVKPEPMMLGPIPKDFTGRIPSACPDLRQYCAEDARPYWRSAKR